MKDRRERPHRKSKRKRLLIILPAAVVAVLVLLFLLTPVIVSSSPVRKYIIGKINSSSNGTADFARLKMGWTKGVRLSDVSFSDATGGVSLKVDEVSTKPHYASFLGGKISLGKTVVDKPRVTIDMRKFEQSSESTEGEPAASRSSGELPIKQLDLIVNDGSVKVTDRNAATTEMNEIDSELNLRPPGAETRFAVAMAVPSAQQTATVTASAAVEPDEKKGFSLAGLNGTVTAEVKDFNVASLGPLLALAGVKVDAKGTLNGKIDSKIADGQLADLTGAVKASGLDVAPEQLKGDRIKTDNLDVDVKLAAKDGLVTIDKLNVTSDFAKANATGSLPMSLKSLEDFLGPESKAAIEGDFDCDVAALSAQLPKTLHIKEGMKISSGKLAGKIETTTVDGQRKIQANAALTNLAGVVEDKKIALERPVNLDAQVASAGETTRFDELKLTSSFATVAMSGTTEQLDYDVQADLSKLQSQVGQFVDFGKYNVAGAMAGKGRVSITEEKITEVGAWIARGLTFSAKEGAPPVKFNSDVTLSVDAALDRKKSVVALDNFDLKSELGNVKTTRAVIPFGADSNTPMAVAVAASGVNLAKAQPFITQFAELPEGWAMSGIAQGDIALASVKDGYSLKTDNTKVANLKVTSPNTDPLIQNEMAAVIDGEVYPKLGEFNIKNLLLQSEDLKIQAVLSKKATADNKTDLKGNADATFEWADASLLVRPLLPEGLEMEGQRTTSINFASVYDPNEQGQMLANLNGQAKFGFDKASYMGLNIDKVDTDVKVEKGMLNLAPFSTTVNNGTAGFAGKIDLTGDPRKLELPEPMTLAKDVEVNAETTQKLLKYVNPVFADVTAISGKANLDCKKLSIPLAKVDPNEVELVATLAMNDINIRGAGFLAKLLSLSSGATRGMFLTVHPTEFTVSKGIMSYTDKMQVDVGDNPFDFVGSIDIKNNRYMPGFKVVTPWTTAGKTVRVGRETTEGSRIEVPINGPVGKPDFNKEEFFKQQVLREGIKLLEDLLKK